MHSQGDIDYIDNEVYSDTRFLICNVGYVPKQKGIPDLTGSETLKTTSFHIIKTPAVGLNARDSVNFIEQNNAVYHAHQE